MSMLAKERLGPKVLSIGLFFLFVLFFVGGCDGCDGVLQSRDVRMRATPDPIAFGVIAARDSVVIRVTIQSEGISNLIIEGTPFIEEFGEGEYPALSIMNSLVPVNCATGEETTADDPNTVYPGQCRIIDVVYSPRAIGPTDGYLVIRSNDDDDRRENSGERRIPITGEADAPDLDICINVSECADAIICYDRSADESFRVEFPLTRIDETRTCELTLSNKGNLNLSSLGWGFSSGNRYQDFSIDPTDISGFNLEPGQSEGLSITFKPVAGGERTAKITLSSNDPAKPQVEIDVIGLGDGPKICPHPMPIVDYGDVEIGTTALKTVALESCGTMPLDISEVWVQDATGRQISDEFFLVAGSATDAVLEPGDVLEMDVEFIPIYEGQVNGRLYFSSNDPIVPAAFVNLTGNGVVPPSCELVASTTNLSFGSAAVGYSPAKRALAVTNAGEIPCEDWRGDVTDGHDAEFHHGGPSVHDQPFTLDPGETFVFNLEYIPQIVGMADSGRFTICRAVNGRDDCAESPDPDNDLPILLSGYSVAEPTCNLEVTPRPSGMLMDTCMTTSMNARVLQFGPSRIGQSKNMSATLTNVGSADCKIKSTEIKSSMPFFPADGFRITHQPHRVMVDGIPTDTIKPGETGNLSISFAPTGSEDSCGDLWIATNSDSGSECRGGFGSTNPGDGCYSIQLRGYGVRATVAAVPLSLDFGTITVDCLSPEREVNIYNTGGVEVDVTGITLSPNDGTFRLTGVPPLPAKIPVGQRLTVNLTYAPTGTPTTHNGTLTVVSNSENSPTVVNLTGKSTTDSYQVDYFEQLSEPMVDVLWVIDDSCSMQDVQDNLRDNIHTFVARAYSQNTDFHMGVITTDWDDPNKAGRLQSRNNWPKIIDRSLSEADAIQAFRDNANVGTGGHHIERGFDAAFMALTEPLIDNENNGFLRDDAKLAIIFVSDEEEQSNASVDFFVDFFMNIKGYRNDSLMSAHAIVGDHPGGCSNNFGSAGAAPRYIEAANRTGGLFRSICTPDWGEVADAMGLDAFSARREFFLSREPIPSTIQVQVNNTAQPSTGNWTYDATTNSIVFQTTAIPPKGATIRVSYEVLCRT